MIMSPSFRLQNLHTNKPQYRQHARILLYGGINILQLSMIQYT